MTQSGRCAAMPAWNEFLSHFGIKEILLAVLTAAIIIAVRERERIFRRKKDEENEKGETE